MSSASGAATRAKRNRAPPAAVPTSTITRGGVLRQQLEQSANLRADLPGGDAGAEEVESIHGVKGFVDGCRARADRSHSPRRQRRGDRPQDALKRANRSCGAALDVR